jgi:hypothetical protein
LLLHFSLQVVAVVDAIVADTTTIAMAATAVADIVTNL